MDHDAYVASVRRDTDALLDAARAAGPAATVDACPGWTVEDLVWHISEVQDFWGTIVAERLQDLSADQQPQRPSTFAATIEFAEHRRDRLVDALAGADPATALWTWTEHHDAAWIGRRMAHEAAVHRWDAEAAADREQPIDAELASDGIDEFLQFFLPNIAKDVPPLGGSVHLHCTDVAGEWLVAVDESDGYVVTREHAKGSAAVRGRAEDLLLVLWRRRPLSTADVVGDADVAERFVARTRLE